MFISTWPPLMDICIHAPKVSFIDPSSPYLLVQQGNKSNISRVTLRGLIFKFIEKMSYTNVFSVFQLISHYRSFKNLKFHHREHTQPLPNQWTLLRKPNGYFLSLVSTKPLQSCKFHHAFLFLT